MVRSRGDSYSANHVMATVAVCAACAVLLCGKSLWIPASRVENLSARSVALATAESLSLLASRAGLDVYVPALREGFVDAAGLSGHSSWDMRYFNKRSSPGAATDSPAGLPPPSAEGTATQNGDLAAATDTADTPAAATTDNAATTDTTATADTASATGDIASSVATADTAVAVRPDRNRKLERAYIYSRERPLEVYFFGDSQVFSLGSGFSRLVGKDSPIRVDVLAIHSSGFIRADYYDWPSKLADTLASKRYGAAVMMLGMNDYQNFWGDDGKALKKRTPQWEAAYKERCRRIIDIALSEVPRVYWLRMPLVKNKAYDESLRYIESVHDSLAGEYSPDTLVRVSLRDSVPGPDRPYAETLTLGESPAVRVMSEDGSHYTVEGGQLATRALFDLMARDFLFSELPVAHLPE